MDDTSVLERPAAPAADWSLPIEGMTCASCVARVEVDLTTKKVRVETPRERATVAAALAEAGYAPAA